MEEIWVEERWLNPRNWKISVGAPGVQKRRCGWKDRSGGAVSEPPVGQRPGQGGCWKEPSKTVEICGPAVFKSSSIIEGNTYCECGDCEASDQGPLISSDSKECFCFCERIWGLEMLRLVQVSVPVCLSPREGNSVSVPGFLPGAPHGQRNLVGCSPWGHKESDMTERLTLTR